MSEVLFFLSFAGPQGVQSSRVRCQRENAQAEARAQFTANCWNGERESAITSFAPNNYGNAAPALPASTALYRTLTANEARGEIKGLRGDLCSVSGLFCTPPLHNVWIWNERRLVWNARWKRPSTRAIYDPETLTLYWKRFALSVKHKSSPPLWLQSFIQNWKDLGEKNDHFYWELILKKWLPDAVGSHKFSLLS